MLKEVLEISASLFFGGLAGYHATGSRSAGLAGALLTLIYRARVYIQGYHFDRYYQQKGDLRGRVVLVTGCTAGGLGFAAAVQLAQMGARLIITGRSEEKAKEACKELSSILGSCYECYSFPFSSVGLGTHGTPNMCMCYAHDRPRAQRQRLLPACRLSLCGLGARSRCKYPGDLQSSRPPCPECRYMFFHNGEHAWVSAS
jgi:hypothetical protein